MFDITPTSPLGKHLYKIAHKMILMRFSEQKSAEEKENSCFKISQNCNFFSDQCWKHFLHRLKIFYLRLQIFWSWRKKDV